MDETDVIGIACGIFSPVLQRLEHLGRVGFPVIYLDSMLHMKPKLLEDSLKSLIEEQRALGKKVILIYGQCHVNMFEMERERGVYRVEGSNCIEMILGTARYRELKEKKSFVLMKEWAQRWEDVFSSGLGFTQITAQMFMPEHHTELLYIDCGLEPAPHETLDACAEYCGLPWRHEKVGFEPLLKAINKTFARIEEDRETP